ncbi:MAG: NAD-dependent deacylase [Negativicutes bacterium]|nr:NAD-dependent deacylase [Negativicutes bacterium]
MSVQQLAAILAKSNYVLAFTGAGMSTDSGIPDFRSADGLWNRMDPAILSAQGLRTDPAQFFHYYREIVKAVKGKEPNPGHYLVAELSKLRIVRSVVTQNIDGLHQRAGSRRVFEVHGNLQRCFCLKCKKEYPHALLEELLEQSAIPLSGCCQAVLRPGVVLFGDKIAPDYTWAREEAFRADFALVIGTSLTVFPAAEIPLRVGRFAIINREKTDFDAQACLSIKGSVGEVLEELVATLRSMDY